MVNLWVPSLVRWKEQKLVAVMGILKVLCLVHHLVFLMAPLME